MKLTITYEHAIPINAFRWTPSDAFKPLHYHSSLEIGLCVAGKGLFLFGDKQYAAAPGDIFIVNNRELHIARSDADNPSEYIFINFDPRMLLEEEEALLLPFSYQSELFDNRIAAGTALAEPIGALVTKIWHELSEKQAGYQSMAKSALLDLCVLLLRHYATGFSEREWSKINESFSRMRPVLDYLEQNYRDPIELSDVAKVLKVSPSRASRIFQELMGVSYKDYLLQMRINEAKRLLISTQDNVADICFESGFQSLASFYRQFGQESGTSPLAYRARFGVHAIIENAGQDMSSREDGLIL